MWIDTVPCQSARVHSFSCVCMSLVKRAVCMSVCMGVCVGVCLCYQQGPGPGSVQVCVSGLEVDRADV